MAAADVIVVACPANPSRRVERVNITPKGKAKDSDKWPPFARIISCWQVIEVLRGTSETSSVGSVIGVAMATRRAKAPTQGVVPPKASVAASDDAR
ncbi:MAG: hypothetical protein Q8O67_32170 [Deltaproteobacteria bacterium]|nr:hypothetical protein [Deltaproteobacteria bacterium]